MEETNKVQHLSWQVPEYEAKERDKKWYIIATIFLLITLFFCFFEINGFKVSFLGVNSNFIFALILILSSIIMIINDGQEPNLVDFKIGPEGINIGKRFYDYDDLRHFSIIYKPNIEVSHLYFEFKNSFVHPRLSIHLYEQDPIIIRNYLLRYLTEDLERLGPPISEQLTKLLKL
jgi:uncharacterized integral membrane protein